MHAVPLTKLIALLKMTKDMCRQDIARVLPYLVRVQFTDRCPEAKTIVSPGQHILSELGMLNTDVQRQGHLRPICCSALAT